MSVPDAEYQKALNHIGRAKAEIKCLEEKLAAILLERDGHRGYGETVGHLRAENAKLREASKIEPETIEVAFELSKRDREIERLRSDRDALLCVCSQVGKELTSRANQLLQAEALTPPAGTEGGARL